MNVTDLRQGASAPETTDRIVIFAVPGGGFRFEGWSAENKGVAVHFVDTDEFPTFDAAREAGILWAEGGRVSDLYVEFRQAE